MLNVYRQQEDEWKEALEKKSLLYRFFNAIYLALIARTEFICYFFMFLCHICYGNILSLPLPICAVLWGMLSLPRPAKTFWITVLTYVMVCPIVVLNQRLWPIQILFLRLGSKFECSVFSCAWFQQVVVRSRRVHSKRLGT